MATIHDHMDIFELLINEGIPIKQDAGDSVDLRYLQDALHLLISRDHSRYNKKFIEHFVSALVIRLKAWGCDIEDDHIRVTIKTKIWNRPKSDFGGWFTYEMMIFSPDWDQFHKFVPDEVR